MRHRPIRRRILAALLALALVPAGCAAPAAPPTPNPPTATTPPPPTATPAPPATATTPPKVDPPSPTSAPSPTVAPTPTAAPAWRFVVQAQGSKLTIRVNEQLAGIPVPSDAVLTTPKLTGQIVVASDGAIGPDSRLTVDLGDLTSDDSDRDDDVKQNYLETDKFPNAIFVPKGFRGLSRPVPTSGSIKAQLAGDLTVHGVTRPVLFDVDGALDGEVFKGKARTEVKITDFGMKVPTLAILLRVEDRVRAEIDLVATTQR